MPAQAGPKHKAQAKKNHFEVPKALHHEMTQAPIVQPEPYAPGGAKVKKPSSRRTRNKGRS